MDDDARDQADVDSSFISDHELKDILIRAQRVESIGALIAHNDGEALISLSRLQRADILNEVSEQITDVRCRLQGLTE